MAISRIRGEQIRQGVLTNAHVGENAAIAESKLEVNWSGHYQNALETKKVVDFVQVGNKVVGGATEYNLSTNGVLDGAVTQTTSLGTTEGVITDAPYNKVVIRDAVTGEPILDAEGEEVYGRLVHDGVDFKVLFYSPGVDIDGNPVEDVFTMPASQEIDFQYMERFNLKTVSELFAANEKFVAGSADVTAHQNINQLAVDLYGAGYTLDRDGEGNLTVNIVQQIADEVTARTEADQAIRDDLAAQATAGKGANLVGIEDAGNRFMGGTVEAVLAEIKDALTDYINKLASNALGEGASQVGVHDANAKFTATTVEAALEELADRATELEQGSNAEVDNAKTRDADSANLYFVIKTFASLEERLVEIETIADAEFKKAQDTTDEVQAARESTAKSADGGTTPKTFASVDARLEEIETDAQADAQALQDHKDAQALVDQAQDGKITDLETEVQAARSSMAKSADGSTPKEFADVDARIEELESDVATNKTAGETKDTEQDGRLTDLETEVHAARGTEVDLDTRLDRALNENGTLKAGQDIHEHFRARYQATGGETQVLLSAFTSKKVLPAAFQVGDDSLEVYINGQLQEEGLNYAEAATGDAVVFDIGDGTVLQATDLIQIRFHINNAE